MEWYVNQSYLIAWYEKPHKGNGQHHNASCFGNGSAKLFKKKTEIYVSGNGSYIEHLLKFLINHTFSLTMS